jgi:hypothetical protein
MRPSADGGSPDGGLDDCVVPDQAIKRRLARKALNRRGWRITQPDRQLTLAQLVDTQGAETDENYKKQAKSY